ncbi:MAG TPA: transporter substrate-binding domain-containing protein [Paralcaligenes sp.]|jgi:ABC-type amino acid transport/signal transduction systems, periplasmic component/domain
MHLKKPNHLLRGLLLLLPLVFVLAGTGSVSYADTLSTIKERGELIAGVKAQYPPFGFVDSSGKNAGFDVDLSRELARGLFGNPDKVKFVTVTSGNRVPYLQSKKIDIIAATVTVTDERKKTVDFSDPYFNSGTLILVPKSSSITGINDLAGKKVAVIQGSIQVEDLADLAPKATLIKFGKTSEAVLAVKTGRADAYAHDDIAILDIAHGDPGLKVVGEDYRPRPFAMAVRKDDAEFLKFVNDRIREMKKDGTFDKLWNRWFGDYKKLVKPQ